MKVFEERGITHLDLHGVRHNDAKTDVLEFVFQYQDLLPLIIICGNSNKMLEIVSTELKKEEILFSSPRFGVLRVENI
ncbi:uncharacterized protein METZ01_LOCUS151231 [marine metagenome]|uniref:Smr domain-containing protein n=1 Tax=marine metagenome TaxID=408172 RepID=A0A382ABK1_9ZZZZ|tara:strand:- start:1711 stop:1944 length:234 start_codon:yes stop_codon:yes gene_type:complete